MTSPGWGAEQRALFFLAWALYKAPGHHGLYFRGVHTGAHQVCCTLPWPPTQVPRPSWAPGRGRSRRRESGPGPHHYLSPGPTNLALILLCTLGTLLLACSAPTGQLPSPDQRKLLSYLLESAKNLYEDYVSV